jgi:CBS domain-containing protein
MYSALPEITGFLADHHPFDLLPEPALGEVAAAIEVSCVREGTRLMNPGDKVDTLFVVRTGAIETRSPDGQLLARLGEGELFGVRALLRGGLAVNQSTAIEDCLLYRIPAGLFARLRQEYPAFSYYFAPQDGGRLGSALEAGSSGRTADIPTKRIRDLDLRGPVTVEADETVRIAARMMRDQKVSCLLVTEGDKLVGILTDKDMRNRVIADGLSHDAPVGRVMSANPRTIDASDFVFNAMLEMSRHNIHHLPVMDDGGLKGCMTATNVLDSQAPSPILLATRIHRCPSPDCMRDIVAGVPPLVFHMVDQGTSADAIGHVVSTLTDAVTERLIRLAEEKLGPAPIPYLWLAAGSQGRQEQTALSDQDNCMILHDSYDPAVHGDYFREFTRFVCGGLDACGYVYCPGEMMAQTDEWRQPLSVWKRYFRRWIEEPEPKALMLCSVFFDLRPLHGDEKLWDELGGMILELTRKNRIFLAYMAGNALSHEPPLGFFRNLVLIRGGDHDQTLDLKHNGVVPIVDLARVHALSAGIGAVNTLQRLDEAMEGKALSHEGAMDLRDALEFIGMVRLRHQARQAADGRKIDNHLSPDELSSMERSHLKNAFAVVKTMQASLANTYQLGRF